MPLYEYKCATDKTRKFVVTRKMSEYNAKEPCPHCNAPGVRVLSLPQLITRPTHLEDNWRDHRSQTEQLEEARAEDREYNEKYKPDPVGSRIDGDILEV